MIVKTFGKVTAVNMVAVNQFLLSVLVLDKDNKPVKVKVEDEKSGKEKEVPLTSVFQANNMTRHTASAYKGCNVQITHERGETTILGIKVTALKDNVKLGNVEV